MPLSFPTAIDLFQGISEDRGAEGRTSVHRAAVPKGTRNLSKGDPANALFIVKNGKVRILSLSDKGTETIVHILKEGAIFGELLLSEEQRVFTAVAGTDALVTVLSKGSLVELLTCIPTCRRISSGCSRSGWRRWRGNSGISGTPGLITASRRSCSDSAKSTGRRPRRGP